jgi:hypothetical protein
MYISIQHDNSCLFLIEKENSKEESCREASYSFLAETWLAWLPATLCMYCIWSFDEHDMIFLVYSQYTCICT